MKWMELIATVIGAVFASSGLWTWLQRRGEKKDVKTKMLIGLAHDRIIYLGMSYVERGWVTNDEYENLFEYLYRPYEQLGGNGVAKRVMDEVRRLEIRKVH